MSWRRAVGFFCALLIVPWFGFGQEDDAVQVGSKKFTEAVILGEAASQWLTQRGTPATHRRELGGTRVLWNALLAGDIDVYGEYTGTLLQEILADQAFDDDTALRRHLAELGLGMTAPLGFNNTYALGMRRTVAEGLGIRSISDLTEHPDLVFGFTNEFLDRQDGWPGLRVAYDLPQTQVTGLDHDLAYRGLVDDALQVVDLYSTDAEIDYYDLLVLEDDLSYFPEYQAIFLYRLDLQQHAPTAISALQQLAGTVGRSHHGGHERPGQNRSTERNKDGGGLPQLDVRGRGGGRRGGSLAAAGSTHRGAPGAGGHLAASRHPRGPSPGRRRCPTSRPGSLAAGKAPAFCRRFRHWPCWCS